MVSGIAGDASVPGKMEKENVGSKTLAQVDREGPSFLYVEEDPFV